MAKDLLIIREYKYETGITMTVKLDRRTRTVSFVEWNQTTGNYVDKKYLFSGRGLSYMNGWRNILTAMRHAIDEATKEMEAWKDEEIEAAAALHMAVDEAHAKKK